ncbi:MAG: response regulator transcription factor [Eggerthella lenta]
MRCIAAGMTIAQAADKLFVSRETVKKHLANIYGKLGVHSKMQAVALLRDAGIV